EEIELGFPLVETRRGEALLHVRALDLGELHAVGLASALQREDLLEPQRLFLEPRRPPRQRRFPRRALPLGRGAFGAGDELASPRLALGLGAGEVGASTPGLGLAPAPRQDRDRDRDADA